MSFEAWLIFATFWAVFVTTPGPNAVNCISNGMNHGLARALWGVAAILTQASLFLIGSALGVTALIAASPTAFLVLKYAGAGFLIFLGVRGWLMAKRPVKAQAPDGASIYWRAFAIATINPKSIAGYIAAFSQFVQPDVPVMQQMWVIMPTALSLTAMSYLGFTTLGVLLGKSALKAVFNVWIRRGMAICFIVYGILLGTSTSAKA